MRVLVTGGAGFIGSNFVRMILDGSLKGYTKVTVLDKLTYAGSLSNLTTLSADNFVLGDICDQGLVEDLAAEHDVIVNFAAESHVDRSISSPKEFLLTNVLGTQTLLEAARLRKIKTFIQISTDEVYGSIDRGSSKETDLLLPNSPYAASKASADLLSRSYYKTFGLDVRVTRCTNNYGPNQYPEKIIPLFITNLIENIQIPVYGSGQNSRDWLHVEDHCRGIDKVLFHGSPGQVYNIGGGTELTNLELTHIILKLMGKSESLINFVPDRLGHDFRYSIDDNKIEETLNYKPLVKFSDGLVKTINWYIGNEQWWKSLKN